MLSRLGGGGALFTLALPASRRSLLGVRVATGLAELLILATAPSLLIVVLSPAAGQYYRIGDVLVHSMCLFTAGAMFYSLAVLLSTVFNDLWRPLLLTSAAEVVLVVLEALVAGQSGYGVFRVMSGEVYFRRGEVPWLGLSLSVALSAAMLFRADRTFSQRDF